MNDPAVLLYTSDFLTGTIDMTMEERGQYITLLCVQHQKGHLSEKTIRLLVGNVSVSVLEHFKQDENGLYYNERMDLEKQKRHNFTESRRQNGQKGGRPKTKKEDNFNNQVQNLVVNHMDTHMGNENENDNINKNIYSYIERLYKRILTSTEITKIDNLIKEYNEELVRYAIDIGIQNNVYKLKYAEAILRDWKIKQK